MVLSYDTFPSPLPVLLLGLSYLTLLLLLLLLLLSCLLHVYRVLCSVISV